MRQRVTLLTLFVVATTGAAQGTRPDTAVTLGSVVVIAERAAAPVNRSSAAITRLTAADLARLPYATVADVLRAVPGIGVVDFDGSGRDPELMARGFYGGGESEYVVVMVDGRPMNLAHNGTIAWETLPPLASIAAIEVVRGGASAAHGDAAVAGAINIITRQAAGRGLAWRAIGESHSGVTASADLTGYGSRGEYRVNGGFDRTAGFRDHAKRASGTLSASARVSRMYRATGRVALRDYEEPGPLLERFAGDPSASDPRFQRDGGDDQEGEIILHQDAVLGSGGTVQSAYRVNARRATLVRTLPLTPEFGDTRERRLSTLSGGMETQVELTPVILPPVVDRVTAGLSLNVGSLRSTYFSEDAGSRVRDARGSALRGGAAGFLNVVVSPVAAVRWTLGIRADVLHDRFSPLDGESASATHFAASPRIGVNVRYASQGHAWVAGSRTFKTPTLDQLFDQRPIPIPLPPFSVTTSNPDLDPQRGTSAEAGMYQNLTLGPLGAGVSATVYQIDMRNELDFDVQTLRYVNIARSRHQGAELGVSLAGGPITARLSAALQDVESRRGSNAGRQLKAVPGQVHTAIVTYSSGMAHLTAGVTRMADMYLDDANTRRLPSWTRVDAQVSMPVSAFTVTVGARNLLDRQYHSTGFLDPGGSGQAYFYPAARRVVTLGVQRGR